MGALLSHRTVRALATNYSGVRFRSTLEANWAFTFDQLGVSWSYEPMAVVVSGVAYLPDFFLPNQRVWAEVKGPHDVRVHKPRLLGECLELDGSDSLVALLRLPVGGVAVVESGLPGQELALLECPTCLCGSFFDLAGSWVCRVCRQQQRLPHGGRPVRFHQIDPYGKVS